MAAASAAPSRTAARSRSRMRAHPRRRRDLRHEPQAAVEILAGAEHDRQLAREGRHLPPPQLDPGRIPAMPNTAGRRRRLNPAGSARMGDAAVALEPGDHRRLVGGLHRRRWRICRRGRWRHSGMLGIRLSARMLRTTSSTVVIPASAASRPGLEQRAHAAGDGGALDLGCGRRGRRSGARWRHPAAGTRRSPGARGSRSCRHCAQPTACHSRIGPADPRPRSRCSRATSSGGAASSRRHARHSLRTRRWASTPRSTAVSR